jgi:hypothetical protein
MKRKIIIIFVILTLLLIAFGFYWFKLRRTAYTVANVLTDLSISKEYKIELFKDEWCANGDGESLIIFSIPMNQQSNLVQHCLHKGFKKLPINIELPDNTIYNYLDKSDSLGFYFLEIDKKDDRNYTICVISQKNKKLIIYNVIY